MICHKNLSLLLGFCLLKGDKKTFLLVENIFWTNENVFLSPLELVSIKKNKEVTSFCDKSCHLFLWQTNRTRLLTAQYLYCEFTLWTYLWTQLAFFKKISVKEASVAKHGHEKWMDCGDEISNIPAIDQHIAACISYVFL